MIFIVGGAYQGKLAFVKEHFKMKEQDILDGEFCELDSLYNAKAINHFHMLIKRIMLEEKEFPVILDKLFKENPNCIIITTEIGCGLVPINKFEREYREKVGRICCEIAKNSKQVYRVQCRIATKIYDKGNLSEGL
jgi:hypothetical protein